jgi:hypothetical protein
VVALHPDLGVVLSALAKEITRGLMDPTILAEITGFTSFRMQIYREKRNRSDLINNHFILKKDKFTCFRFWKKIAKFKQCYVQTGGYSGFEKTNGLSLFLEFMGVN